MRKYLVQQKWPTGWDTMTYAMTWDELSNNAFVKGIQDWKQYRIISMPA